MAHTLVWATLAVKAEVQSVFEVEAFAFGETEGCDAGEDEGGGEDDEGHGLVAAGQGQEPRHQKRRNDGGDHEGDEADVHGIERPADAGGDEEFAMRLVERQSVEALVAGELCGLR